jgi:alpha,alpha-trehalase
VLLRRIEAVDGPTNVTVILDLRGGYAGSRSAELSRHGNYWTGRSGAVRFRWSSTFAATR